MSQESSPLLSTTLSYDSKGDIVLSVHVPRVVPDLHEIMTTRNPELSEVYSVSDAISVYLVAISKMLNYIAEPQFILMPHQQKGG